jgi:PPOX class probable F420-dependent enzyme
MTEAPRLNTIPESHRDLMETNPTVTVATVGPSGAPQVTAAWFLVDDEGRVRLSLNTARQKTKNMQRNPKVSIYFQDPANPYRTLELRGHVEIDPDPHYVLADQVGAKYGGADLREQDRPGESRVAVTVVPERVFTFG